MLCKDSGGRIVDDKDKRVSMYKATDWSMKDDGCELMRHEFVGIADHFICSTPGA